MGIGSVRAGWESATATVQVSDDFYTYEAQASDHLEYYSDTNLGKKALLVRGDSGYRRHAFLLFEIPDNQTNLTAANLTIYVYVGASKTLNVESCDYTNISEITWDTESSLNCTQVGSASLSGNSAWTKYEINIDVSQLKLVNNTVLLRLSTPATDTYTVNIWAEEEGGDYVAKLSYEFSYLSYQEIPTELTISEIPLLVNCHDELTIEGNLTANGSALAGMTVHVDLLDGDTTLISKDVVTTADGVFSASITIPDVSLAKSVIIKASFDGYTTDDKEYINSSVERTFVITCSSSSSSDNTSSSSSDYITQLLQLWSYIESSGGYLSSYIQIPTPILTMMIVLIVIGIFVTVITRVWKYLLGFIGIALILALLGVI